MYNEHYPEAYSIYTQDLLARPPAWLLRWGGTLIFSTVMTLLLMSWLIKYPEIIKAEAILTTSAPPIAIIAKQEGKLHWLKSREQSTVSKGETIAVINNPAELKDVKHLKQWLSNYASNQSIVQMPTLLTLGEIQQSYAHFEKLLHEYNFFLKQNNLATKTQDNLQQQRQLHQLIQQYDKQLTTLKQQRQLLNKKRIRNKILQNKNLIAANAIDEIDIELLNNLNQQEQIATTIGKTRLEILNQKSQLNQETTQHQEKSKHYTLQLTEARQNLYSAITHWEQSYLLQSPITGSLTYAKYWSEYQYVKTGDEVVTVVPISDQPILAKIKMPMENSGKVKTGQTVLIKLTGYPYQEYGQLKSSIHSISLVPRENHYTLQAIFPNKLFTSFNKQLHFNQEMSGTAEIITEDMRLIERFFYHIVKILK